MSSSRIKTDRSNVHASHEDALRESIDKLPEKPAYEVLERAKAKREYARSRAERVLSRWLEDLGAREIDLGHRGADIGCLAECDLGRIAVVMRSPFRVGRDVRALCDPCLVRVEIGDAPKTPEAWSISSHMGSCVVQVATAGDGICGVLTPGVSVSRLFPAEEGNTWIGAVALKPFLERVSALAELAPKERKSLLFEESRELAEHELRRRPWADVASCKPKRWQRRHWSEVQKVASTLESFMPFDTFELRKGARCGWGASLLVGDKEREVKAAPLVVASQIRGRSERWKIELDADLYRLDVPAGVDEQGLLVPSSWVLLRIHLGASSEQGDHKLLLELDDDSTHHFWIETGRLITEGFSQALGDVASQAAAIHLGPYR